MTGLTPKQVAASLELSRTQSAMYEDPDLTGDTLALALALSWVCSTETKMTNWSQVTDPLGWRDGAKGFRFKQAICKDFPRYELDGMDRRGMIWCGAAMIRREGLCGKSASLVVPDRDPMTGAGSLVGFCSRHGAQQFYVQARMKQWRENGCPEPPHNKGGVLRRYFDGFTDATYEWSNYGQKVTQGDGKPPTPPRPKLRLIVGGAA